MSFCCILLFSLMTSLISYVVCIKESGESLEVFLLLLTVNYTFFVFENICDFLSFPCICCTCCCLMLR